MEPPVVPTRRQLRLTKDYTSDGEAPRSPSRGAWGMDIASQHHLQQKIQADLVPKNLDQHIRTSSWAQDPPNMDQKLENVSGVNLDRPSSDEQRPFNTFLNNDSQFSRKPGSGSNSDRKLPDFFAKETFRIVLHNPTTFHQLLKFCQSRLCGENMEFLEIIDRYNLLLSNVANQISEIHRDYISTNAHSQINIHQSLLIKVNDELHNALVSTLPKLECLFVDIQSDIERLVERDIYPRFVRHQLTMSATRALAGDRGRYAGLGDCFVLTDPGKADNPIVYATDGFVKVTGYSRKEIIPRNCRFLQCRHTDSATVRRLRDAIDTRKASVELLLNQKKSGEPFWNLLYTTPLYDSSGHVVFFLGGQINCSTTIHNASDVLRILGQSTNSSERAAPSLSQPEIQKSVSKTNRFFSSLRNKAVMEAHTVPGMEDKVLEKMERISLAKQVEAFYTAYSKYIVINYSTFFVCFYSPEVFEALYPAKSLSNSLVNNLVTQIIGIDIFRFLSMHSSSRLGGTFKSKVRQALKLGNAISLDLNLCTRRYMGFEKFASHWTPLKNEVSETGFVICTLAAFED